ncbi:MAG: hypothetical protein JST67_02680 [Bacteroidetes bacterium]|nr:hypothetical protein [Bacteroidota bacterium]
MKKLPLIFACACCIFVLSFCKRGSTSWNDDLVAPLAQGNLTLGNLFPDTTIKTNSDSSLSIMLQSPLINYQLDSLLKIPDTTITTAFTFSFAMTPTITAGSPLYFPPTPTIENPYPLSNGIQLKKAIIKSGKINYTLTNQVYRPITYHYILLSATKNNQVLDQIFTIPATDSVTGQVGSLSGSIDISGYTVDFTGINHNKVNTTVEMDSVYVARNASLGWLHQNQGFHAAFTFSSVVPQYAVGYFGSQTVSVHDTSNFTAFNSIKKGILNLNSANVSMNVSNQFGVSMRAAISNVNSINTNNPSNVVLNVQPNMFVSSAVNNGLGNPVGASTNAITLNNTNSNISSFIGNLPNKLSYSLTAQVNPMGNQSGSNDFGYYGTSFSAVLNINVPLFFSASNLILGDTQKLNLSGVTALNNINSGNLILSATNSYPFSINLNAVLLDQHKQVLGSLPISPNTITAPALNTSLQVIAPQKSVLYIPLTPALITNLQKAQYIYYTATFNTTNQPSQIKFYNNYTLQLLLTADVNYTVGGGK